MYLKYGEKNVVPFTSKEKAKKFKERVKKQGYEPVAFQIPGKKGIYFVASKPKRKIRKRR